MSYVCTNVPKQGWTNGLSVCSASQTEKRPQVENLSQIEEIDHLKNLCFIYVVCYLAHIIHSNKERDKMNFKRLKIIKETKINDIIIKIT